MKTQTRERLIYTPKESFVANIDGVDIVLKRDRDRIREGHELLERFPEMFIPLDVQYEVEQATAEPGELR